MPFVKHSYLVKNASDLPRIFKEAFHIAGTGRKGPVLIDVPIDVQQAVIKYEPVEEVAMRTYKPTFKGNTMQVKKIAKALEAAKKPLICAGGGVFASDAADELIAFAEKSGIPAVSTMMGISLFPTDHPLYMGMLGMHGVKTANHAVSECDTLILIGARVGDRAVTSPSFLAENKKIIHIDIDPAEIGKNIETDIPLVGDCKAILTELTDYIEKKDRSEWLSELNEVKNSVPTENETEGYVNPKMFIRKLSNALPDNSVCVADVGQNQIWACNNFNIKKGGRFLTSGGMGTMGYSVPAAVGAKMAAPDKEVVVICGDGSFQMQMMELATIVQENIAVKIIIMRNNRLGMVRELQTKAYKDQQIAVRLTDGNPDFAMLAKAYGIDSMSVSNMSEAEEAIGKLAASDKPFLLEVNVFKNESTL